MKFIETHVFFAGPRCTPEHVNASVVVEAESLELANRKAASVHCDLQLDEDGFTLIRDGKSHFLPTSSICFENTSEAARARLEQSGSPIPIDDPLLSQKAIQGGMDGSLVITEEDLVRIPFDPDWVHDAELRKKINKSDHLAYVVKPLNKL